MASYLDQKKYQNEFDSRAYLNSTFCDPDIHEIRHITEFYSSFPVNSLDILDYSGGPSLLNLINAAPKASKIIFAEYAEQNKKEVNKWLNDEPDAFDWTPAVKYCLEVEGLPTDNVEIQKRQALLRKKIEAVVHCDLAEKNIIEECYMGPYDVVTCIGVLDAICATRDQFSGSVKKISTLVKKDGYLIITTDGSEGYVAGAEFITPLTVTAEDCKEDFTAAGFTKISCFSYTTFADVVMTIGQKI